MGSHQRKDWWKPLRQHGFTRPGRADHQYVMPTGSCSLQRPFRMFLSVHIAIIVFFCRTSSEEITTIVPRWLDHRETLSEGNGFGRRVWPIHRDIFHHGRFVAVVCWQDQTVVRQTGHTDRQCSRNGLNLPVEREGSPTNTLWATHADGINSSASRMPMAMARSRLDPSFLIPAWARLTVMRVAGK